MNCKPCCAASCHTGNVDVAVRLFNELKQVSRAGIDLWTYSCLIKAFSCAVAASTNRKKQLILSQRAFAVMDDAIARGLTITSVVWNALLDTTVKAYQLERGFQVSAMGIQHG
jgi:hypothetical protein